MSANALALPLTSMKIETGINEDWVDSIVYLVDSTDPIKGPQLDLRGMSFFMHVRRFPPETEVIIEASTETGGLWRPPPPDYGYLIIWIPRVQMRTKIPGGYVGDIMVRNGTYERIIVQFELTIIHGVTRWVLPPPPALPPSPPLAWSTDPEPAWVG